MSEDESEAQEGFGAYLLRCTESLQPVSLVVRGQPCRTCGDPWITLKIGGNLILDCCLSLLPRDRDALGWGVHEVTQKGPGGPSVSPSP